MNKDKVIKDLKERNNKLKHQYELLEIREIHYENENKQLKERINNADEFCDRYMGCDLELFDMYELLNKIREILGDKE